MKPRVTREDQQAYDAIAALPENTAVTLSGEPATFTGMTGYLITLRMKRRTVYLRAGDKRILEIKHGQSTP